MEYADQGHLQRYDNLLNAKGETIKGYDYHEPDADQLTIAKDKAVELYSTAFGDTFSENFVLSYAGLRKVWDRTNYTADEDDYIIHDVYVVAYERYIEGLPVLFDDPPSRMGYFDTKMPDALEIWMVDDQLYVAMGTIRDLSLRETTGIISAEQALDVLKANFDSTGMNGTFDITRFELLYYTYYTYDEEKLISPFSGGERYVKYIPVWVVASGERWYTGGTDGTNGAYVMIIDAVTGEICQAMKEIEGVYNFD